ncbi:MAG: DUF1295 domain-containing protein [Candidatus Aminicenantes bacterium]|nr:DUF1295 domain-containing protein [Candidatus Aminicenantes bacterium]
MEKYLLYAAAAVFLYMVFMFFVALLKKDNSIVDIAWGGGFILVAGLTFFLNGDWTLRSLIVTCLVVIWGSRLALYILIRRRGKGEDFRYAKWRKEWGQWFVLRSFFQIFMLQGLLLLIISYSVILVNHSTKKGLGFLDYIGILVWIFGFFFEAVGDYQLYKFKKKAENKGKIMQSGLWRYTRHPNYFGEAVMWWGVFLIALSVRHGWTAVISPLIITFLLLRVSGVIMLEKKYEENDEYATYARKTNAFLPWLQRKNRT